MGTVIDLVEAFRREQERRLFVTDQCVKALENLKNMYLDGKLTDERYASEMRPYLTTILETYNVKETANGDQA